MQVAQLPDAQVQKPMIHLLSSRRWYGLCLLILLLGAAWTIQARVPLAQGDVAQIPSPREGFPAPNFVLDDFDGASLALDSLRGQVVIINLWASWCGPCRAEMPALQKVYKAQRDRGLVIVGVNSTIQDTEANARTFASEMGVSFPLVLDRDGSVTSRYRVRALPTTFILDRQGVIRSVIVGGPLSQATLESKIDALLDADATP